MTLSRSVANLFPHRDQTRTEQTEQDYRRRARALVRQFEQDAGRQFDLMAFVEWLAGREEELAASTARQYWGAILFVLRTHPEDVDRNAPLTPAEEAMIDRFRTSHRPSADDLRRLPTRTSARKLKSVAPDRLERLVRCLMSSGNWYDADAAYLLLACIVTGLRPSEWRGASLNWDDEQRLWVLTVQNGKATNGRAHGHDRKLGWPDGDPSLGHVRRWLERLHEILPACADRDAAWDALYKRLRDALRRANQRVSPLAKRHVTFYTARHVFAAHAKDMSDRDTVAAQLGHGNDRTAGRHYAGAIRGRRFLPSLPQASARDVARIKSTVSPPPLERAQQQAVTTPSP